MKGVVRCGIKATIGLDASAANAEQCVMKGTDTINPPGNVWNAEKFASMPGMVAVAPYAAKNAMSNMIGMDVFARSAGRSAMNSTIGIAVFARNAD